MSQTDSPNTTSRRALLNGKSNVIPLFGSGRAATRSQKTPPRPKREQSSGKLTGTRQNFLLRQERHQAWREADAIRTYWRARLKMEGALYRVQGLPEGNNHPPYDERERLVLIANWRQAVVKQLLTPAPDTRAVAWKRDALARNQHKHTDIKTERIERAIAEDMTFLAWHPIRRHGDTKKRSLEMEQRRQFKEAVRQRIRDIAASRDLSREDIEAPLKLKHQEIARFCKEHSVNLGWLLDGNGRIFR
jgi:hypothetical protein